MTRLISWIVGVLIIVASVSAEGEAAASGPAHLFVLAGQSNMAGLNPEESFTPAVKDAFGADRVIVVKDAKGGEPIRRWYKQWAPSDGPMPANNGDLYDRLLTKVRGAVGTRPLLSVTLVWMQGERDAKEAHADVYAEALRGLRTQLANDLRREDIHLVIGRLSDFDPGNKRYPHWTRIREVQESVAAEDTRFAMVDTDDLNDGLNRAGRPIKNDLHYSADGYRTLGRRFAEESIRLIREHRKPNFVLVMADDQGWGDTGYNGHPFVNTPTLDAMAADGLVLDRFYAAAPVCSPTRASVMTGRSPIRTKVTNHGRYMRPHEYTIGEALHSAGYATGFFGKFHLGSGQPNSPCNPGAAGFEEWVIGLNFFDNDPYLSRNGVVEHRQGRGSSIVVDDAIDFLRRRQDDDRPFLTVVWFPSPHDPHQEVTNDPGLYQGRPAAGYYQEITLLDQELGRVRTALRDLDLAENTVLWYCSDNGGLVGESSGGRDRKGSIYEGGLRVPAMIEWPGQFPAGRSALPAFACDIFPTVMSIAGLGRHFPQPLDGIDLYPALRDGSTERATAMGFWHKFQGGQATWSDRILKAVMEKQQQNAPLPHDPGRMKKDVDDFPQFDQDIATGHAAWTRWPWKLHRIEGDTYELYHLERDPAESTNLFEDPDHSSVASELQVELRAWMRSVIGSLNGTDYDLP